jgi:hypothetical protein
LATFAEMEAEAPQLAERARERFAATGLCLVGTLRSDGWPRISPVEPLVVGSQLYLGMMPGSTKSRDLARDARCLVHSTVSAREGTDGEVKLYGQARRVNDPDEIERYCRAIEEVIGWRPRGDDDLDLWLVYLARGAYVRFDGGTQRFVTWEAGRPVRQTTKVLQP